MLTLEEMINDQLLICPCCRTFICFRGQSFVCANSNCLYSSEPFLNVLGLPVLVDFDKSVISARRLSAADGGPELKRDASRLKRLLRTLVSGRNRVAPEVVGKMCHLLKSDLEHASVKVEPRVRILIVGGGSIGAGVESLYTNEQLDVIAFDVYSSPFVQFIGDGHAIPLADASVDGVIIQAVLEHVTEPWKVAEEVHRVLREGGLVYADTPFMQQVHEGAWDFTRFTESGHRYLFRRFDHIDSGAVGGAGTALVWSIEYFARALTRSTRVGRLVGLCFFWLRSMDRLLDPRYSLDAASGVYFLGRKREAAITRSEIIDYYQGGMKRRVVE